MKKPQKRRYRLAADPEARTMVREQFGILSQTKEWKITESVMMTKQNLTTYVASLGFVSKLTENMVEYIVKAVPKLTFKRFFKFLVEGMISACPYVSPGIMCAFCRCRSRSASQFTQAARTGCTSPKFSPTSTTPPGA